MLKCVVFKDIYLISMVTVNVIMTFMDLLIDNDVHGFAPRLTFYISVRSSFFGSWKTLGCGMKLIPMTLASRKSISLKKWWLGLDSSI